MTTIPPYVADREALARGLHDTDLGNACDVWPCAYSGESYYDQADALIASGVVQTPAAFVAGLAGDEAVVERINAAQWDVDLADCKWHGTRRTVVQHLRALAAALGATQ